MKLAKFWEPYKEGKEKEQIIQCHLCPHNCMIAEGNVGICRVRQNIKGRLYSLVYGRPVSTHIDPIEKKPLFHFLPGTNTYSFGIVGCNLKCEHCQNWEISQALPKDFPVPEVKPEDIVKQAKAAGCPSISYTYTEPTIFYEYALDIASIAREEELKNVMITNGYMNEKPVHEIYRLIDAANVDLKGFNEEFYQKVCGAKLEHVLAALKTMKKAGTWIELTNLIIPGKNDDMEEIKDMCEWIVAELGDTTPLHFSRFFPMYKMKNIPSTPEQTLVKAKEVAQKAGLKFVYVGNIVTEKGENTYCPKCRKLLVARSGFGIVSNNIRDSRCAYCKEKIEGVWE
ncbi:MAG: AmmeMemoRadiSam system radical SAM enzyme [Candidatus Woesearchaeota archaeon]|nr:AmmeMemoRadiSam system radical SAM enzyme [Candidatus Woesearchaeota archaeon]